MWPDWDIFESSRRSFFLQKYPKYLATFGAILKTSLLSESYIVATFWKNWASLYYLNIWPHCRKTSGFCFTKNVEKLQSKRLLSLAIFLIDFWHPPIPDLPMGNHSTSFVSFHLGNHPMAWSSKNQIRRNQSGSLFCVFLLIYLFI